MLDSMLKVIITSEDVAMLTNAAKTLAKISGKAGVAELLMKV
jgi:hypothetical protein